MISVKVQIALAAAASLTALAAASPSAARGCNGVVSQLEWGCAAWDNNNGPQYPHYRAPAAASNSGKVVYLPGINVPPGTVLRMVNGNLVNANTGQLVASGAGNLVASGAGNLVASGAGNLVASGAGNFRVQ